MDAGVGIVGESICKSCATKTLLRSSVDDVHDGCGCNNGNSACGGAGLRLVEFGGGITAICWKDGPLH